jgi:hypothetical protein
MRNKGANSQTDPEKVNDAVSSRSFVGLSGEDYKPLMKCFSKAALEMF